jgi:hypothetical protein
MLIALGFLSACLLGLIIFPAFWRRAVRLTTARLKEHLPLTEDEIIADKDRLRAEYAIQVHQLETQVERAMLDRSRMVIEINRRDATISDLEQERSRLTLLVDENQNARRVLEQTVADRLPKIEARLGEARQALFNRDRDIAELTQNAQKQLVALEEAKAINAQQSGELERLTNALTVRGARHQQSLADPSFEGGLALRAEIEALRAKARDQAGLIGRLQAQMAARPALMAPGPGGEAILEPVTGGRVVPHLFAIPNDAQKAAAREQQALKSKVDDQAAEIARLTAELAAFQAGDDSVRDSKIALKARFTAAQAQLDTQAETILRLRAEIASANERLAIQGAHFMEQMRRLGAGTLPAAGQQRRPVTIGQKLTLSERVAQSRGPLRPHGTPTTERPAAPQPPPAVEAPKDAVAALTPITPAPSTDAVAPVPASHADALTVLPPPPLVPSGTVIALPVAAEAQDGAPIETEEPAAPRRQRLVDRLAGLNKA